MTREEANNELIEMCNYINGNIEIRRKQYEALNMAIEALKQIEAIDNIIDVSNTTIQEDVIKYKMIVDVVKGIGDSNDERRSNQMA